MFNWFLNLNYIYQALIATLFTYSITALGASIVFFFKKISKNVMDAMLGFAAGVMTAASYFSLLGPAIDHSNNLNINPWLTVTIGFLSGGILLFLADKIFSKLLDKKNKRILMLISSITIHNIPEGCSCYVSCWKDNIGLNLKFKNYQDNLYYYFDSLFDFYKHYFNSSSIICFILSISGKNKFVPCFFSANNELKFSNISSFKLSATLTGAPLIVCG